MKTENAKFDLNALIQQMEQQILDYKREIESKKHIIERYNYCVVDNECHIFTIGVNDENKACTEHKTFPTLFTEKVANEIANAEIVERKNSDGNGWHKVELVVMTDIAFYQMKIEELQNLVGCLKK